MSKHTPGPWRTETDPMPSRGSHIYVGSLDKPPGHAEHVALHLKAVNAARIVACVNACEGIEDPSAVPEMLAALKGILEYSPRNQRGREYSIKEWDTFEALKALIARAEGRK